MGEPAVPAQSAAAATRAAPRGSAQALRATWAVGGVALLFVDAIVRLGLRAHETLSAGLSAPAWLAFGVSSALFVYGEGYRALQLRFAPQVVARALTLDGTRLRDVVLAPLFALSLIGAERRAMARAYLAVLLIAAAALTVSFLPSPWRGIIDGAVALALGWGLVALLVQLARALRG